MMNVLRILSALLNVGQQNANNDERAKRASHEASNEQQVLMRDIVRRVDNLEQQSEAQRKQTEARNEQYRTLEQKRYRLEKIGLVVLVAYTGLTGYLACQTRNSVAVAHDALKVSEQSVLSGQRAYILVEDIHWIDRQVQIGSRMWLQWQVKNAGLTPAHQMRAWADTIIGTDPPPYRRLNKTFFNFVIGPGEFRDSPDASFVWLDETSGRKWTIEDAARTTGPNAKERLWVRITVSYETVFPNVIGETVACAYYEGSTFTSCGTELK